MPDESEGAAAREQFLKAREGTLQLVREFIDANYEDFASSTLTFRSLKTNLSDSTGLPYAAFDKDTMLGTAVDDEVSAITSRCDTGKEAKACIFAADFVPVAEPEEPASSTRASKLARDIKAATKKEPPSLKVKLTELATEYGQHIGVTVLALVAMWLWRRRASKPGPSKRQRNARKPPGAKKKSN